MSIFDSIRVSRTKRTAFDLSYENKLTCDMGKLIPVLCKEVLPGDKWRLNTSTFIRFSPLRSPILQSIDAYVHYFYVPNRLLMPQKDWETFISGGKTGEETAQLPYVSIDDVVKDGLGEVGSLADYLGYPVQQTYGSGSGILNINLEGNDTLVSTLPLRAYQLIWQEYYRDQNLTDEVFDFQNADASDANQSVGYELADLLTLRRRCWKKDYFTSALPFVQRGAPATIGLSGEASLKVKAGVGPQFNSPSIKVLDDNGTLKSLSQAYPTESGWSYDITAFDDKTGYYKVSITNGVDTKTKVGYLDPNGSLVADLSTASSVTINDLRRAESLQTWLERNALGGARYIEQIMAHFGVRVPDARLQRPEYLGGGRQPVAISEVLQNSASVSGQTPQGTMAGHGISAGQTISFNRKFEEHGFIIGIMSIMPRASYSQGLSKMFTRFDKLDYAFPEFAHLGEQPILRRELYINGTNDGQNNATFGYQSVYADYKFSQNEIHGDFKTNLSYWHQGRIFSGAPALNQSFVEANPSTRVFAVTSDNSRPLFCQLYHSIQAIRPLPKYGTPRMSI